ncbi:MAG: hypothetical protein H0X65_15280 [Gemmatimonadetes bacterium]|nr:hypothetical protein [Gemmatimonadota bacterium]
MAVAQTEQTARDIALGLAREAQAARECAEEEAEFAREHARGAAEYMAKVLEPELAEERARRANLEADLIDLAAPSESPDSAGG